MKKSERFSLSWVQILLAILPGIVLIGVQAWQRIAWYQNRGQNSSWLEPGVMLATCLLVISIGFWQEHRITVWSLTAVGVFVPLILFPAPALIPRSSLFLNTVVELTFIVAWIIVLFIFWRWQIWRLLPRSGWLLLASALLFSPFLFFLGGEWLFLPIAFGLWFAGRYGTRAVLFTLPMMNWVVSEIADPSYGILIWTDNTMADFILGLLPTAIFLIIVPVWFLRARSRMSQMAALLSPVLVGLLAAEVWVSRIFSGTGRGAYTLSMWWTRGGGVLQLVLVLAFAFVLYEAYAGYGRSPTTANPLPTS
jgi:hypothetical protein